MTVSFMLGAFSVFVLAFTFIFGYSWIFNNILKKFNIKISYSQSLKVIGLTVIVLYLATYLSTLIVNHALPLELAETFIILILIATAVLILWRAYQTKSKYYTTLILTILGSLLLIMLTKMDFLLGLFFTAAFLAIWVVVSSFFTFFPFHYLLNKLSGVSFAKSIDIYIATLIIPLVFLTIVYEYRESIHYDRVDLMYQYREFDRFDDVDLIVPQKIDDDITSYDTVTKATVIGLPGEKVRVKDNQIYINDEKILDIRPEPAFKRDVSITLSGDNYFVVGSEQTDFDSSVFGTVLRVYLLPPGSTLLNPRKLVTFKDGYDYGIYFILGDK